MHKHNSNSNSSYRLIITQIIKTIQHKTQIFLKTPHLQVEINTYYLMLLC